MLKVYSKKTISTILASSLIFGLGTAVVNAAPNTNNSVTTGRTEQNVATGVISPDKLPALAHGATDVTLTGTVVIDGPQLVLLVNGQDVSSQATLTKVANKTWTYQYKTSVGNQTDDVTFNIDAYTIYTNGKPAGQTHTTATAVGQIVHVPFVKSYDYTNLNWTDYDRSANEFTFSYNLVKVWDDGVREVVTDPVNSNISGTEIYQNSGFEIKPPVVVQSFEATEGTFSNYNRANNTYDLTFDLTKKLSDGTSETITISKPAVEASHDYVYTASSEGPFAYSQDFTFTPPTVFRDFTFSTDSPVWTYNASNNTYSVSFAVNETWSNGETATEIITRDGLTPGIANEVGITINGVTHTTSLTAPAAPAPIIPSSVTGTVDENSIQSIWTGNDANGGNVQEFYTLSYTINGIIYTQSLKTNFTKTGTGLKDQNLTYNASYKGQTVLVNYTLLYIQPVSIEDNTSTSGGNGNGNKSN
ncbi:hypothetical protein ACIQ4Z_17910 [Peribacillus asahii]|uniref:hypothetical protein n=1 Tax=Peribacillus asahii TaxID=228899 RepID=UPI00380F72CD